MIQFNLLPDVKLDYIRAKNLKRTVLVVAGLVSASAAAIFILMFLTVNVFQKTHLSHLNTDIADKSEQLKSTKDLDKVLTIQNQLNSLPALHDKKPVTSRLFNYLGLLVPAQVSIGKFDLDFDTSVMNVSGTTDSLGTVNKFVDTLKFTTYTYEQDGNKKEIKPFSSVVMASFGRTDKEATYQVKLSFDKAIFDSANKGTLVVPKITSTRSETEKPTDLFKDLPVEQKAQ